MSSNIDYDKSEPKHIPIILSIILTIVVILILTYSVILYFKGSLTIQQNANEVEYGKAFDLQQLNKYEEDYFNRENHDKINLDDAINITINNYN